MICVLQALRGHRKLDTTARYQNKRVIYDLLFKASAQAMLTIAADPKHLEARGGITAVLHTWGSTMTHHPHVHMIVPSGGLSADQSRWISSRPRFLLAVRVLSRLLRCLFLAGTGDHSGRANSPPPPSPPTSNPHSPALPSHLPAPSQRFEYASDVPQ